MPADKLNLNPPIQYPLIWFLIGCGVIALVGCWYGWVFWTTRKNKFKTIDALPLLNAPLTLGDIKQHYLQLIDECYQRYQRGEVDLRGLHRGLSMTVRYFVYDTKHFPAPRLTLSDFRRAPYPQLTKLINQYYPDEFDIVRHGDPLASVEAAKELVRMWA